MIAFKYLVVNWEICQSAPSQWTTTVSVWPPGRLEASEDLVQVSDDWQDCNLWLRIVNELGREGWRLVSHALLSSAEVDGSSYGRPMGQPISWPIRERWTFEHSSNTAESQ